MTVVKRVYLLTILTFFKFFKCLHYYQSESYILNALLISEIIIV